MTYPHVDLRHEQVAAHPKTRVRKGATVQRKPGDVIGVVVHQTAVRYDVSKRQLERSQGNRQLALARRSLNVACHALAFRDGFFAVPHHPLAYVHHANGLNPIALGLEIDGCYPGLCDDPSTMPRREDLETTWGGDPDAITDTVIDCARAALAWLVTEARALGCPVEYVWAHRQSSATRRSDPGESLWRTVVLDYAVPVLGLRTQPRRVWGVGEKRGRPIPPQWSPDGVGGY